MNSHPQDGPSPSQQAKMECQRTLLADIGLEPVYLGGVDRVNLVEGMTDTWFNLALKQRMGRRLAFKLLI
ncbi:MAG: hypothetical protein VYA30_09610 [Myxococcota bacterium]|nr:hypothetical protein [Myxococcota bacterium]